MQLLDSAFWFSTRPPLMAISIAAALAAIFVVMIVVGIFTLRKGHGAADRYRVRAWRKLGTWWISWGIFGLLWTFLAYERINFFGARFWVLVGLVLAIVWLAFIIKYWKKVVPSMETLRRERAEFEKYLPKKKR